LLSGCAPQPDVTATASDKGRSVAVGELFDIVLPDDYDESMCQWHDKGGYDWAVLRPLGQRYQPDPVDPGYPDTGTYTARYRAVSPGTVHVTLSQEDNGGRVCRTYDLDVTVH
jgi:hypothetical protein